MALTPFQRRVIRLLARTRLEGGESYVAGGVALNEHLLAPRISADVDLFHDTEQALEETFARDSARLEEAGFALRLVRERPAFVEAAVSQGDDTVILQWVRDSSYRFFPLVTHPELGLSLHPFDLATNKVLALVGRLEVRDWIDVIECHDRLQSLGYLAWAACGKDPGFSPLAIVEHAARQHYSRAEIDSLSFEGPPPDAGALSIRWRQMLSEARALIDALPADRCGTCVVDERGVLFRGNPNDARDALAADKLQFHPGRIGGALPRVVG